MVLKGSFVQELSREKWFEQLQKNISPQSKKFDLMYSSLWGGYVTDSSMMVIPMDDHQVHRGDAVFEAIKFINKKIYLLDAHIERLKISAEKIYLPMKWSSQEIKNLLQELVNVSKLQSGLIRLFLSRGPGGFTTNPYDSVGPQLYVILTPVTPPSEQKYKEGCSLGRSQIEQKSEFWSQIKSCNYLPNVLMKKESVDRGVDLTVGFDAQGFMTESSTENIVIVDRKGNLCRPLLRNILKGTTMLRAFQMAESLIAKGVIAAIQERDLHESDLILAKEVMVIGTTWDVMAVTSYQGQKIGGGLPGPCALALNDLIRQDQLF